MCRYTWIYVSTLHTKCIHDFKVAINIAISNYVPRYAFTIRCIDDFIIYIGKILYISHFISYMLHVATDYVPSYERTSIANVRMIIWCYATYIHLRFTWRYWSKHLFLARHCIINCNFSHRYRCLHVL